MILKTFLISGAGNTFHLIYLSPEKFSELNHSQMRNAAVQVCQHNKADGFIFLTTETNADEQLEKNFKWQFFNNDGSDAEMCGNATRCVGYFIEQQLHSKVSTWNLKTVAGLIQISAHSDHQYKIVMNPFKKMNSTKGFFCDTGVPHLVIEVENSGLLSGLTNSLKEAASRLRFDSEFSPKGTNVTYVYLEKDPHRLKAVSFERGVEDFTEACGTGAAAAAFYNLTKRSIAETEVEMPGGTLIMNLNDTARPEMTGPAELLGSFENEISL
jgi:diaminopimelate epimerase